MTLRCNEFFDAALFKHGNNSYHHRRCRAMDPHGPATCDAIASHIDDSCSWNRIGSSVSIVHFKGKNKPWKHNLQGCEKVALGALRYGEDGIGAAAPLRANDTLLWSQQMGVCVSGSSGREVLFADKAQLRWRCCQTITLLKCAWFRHARQAGWKLPSTRW